MLLQHNEEAKIAREVEAHEKRIRKELEAHVILSSCIYSIFSPRKRLCEVKNVLCSSF
jgi:hypothetical protein